MFVSFTVILFLSSLSTVSFGNVRVKRVIGGSPVKSSEFAYFALIRINKRKYCGGAMIARDWIITAASCLGEKIPTPHVPEKTNIEISVGVDDIDDREWRMLEPPFIHFPHPGFIDNDTRRVYNNVLLIKLIHIMGWPGVGIVDLPGEREEENIEEHNGAIALGMGNDESGQPSRVLKASRMEIFENEECREYMPPDQFCAGTADGRHDMCDGDGGGPLVAADKPTLLGIHAARIEYSGAGVNKSNKCGGRDLQSQYSRVSLYVPWIRNMMDSVK